MAQEFQQYLKKVQTLSSTVGRGLDKFNQPPGLGQLPWLDCLTRLNLIRSDFAKLYNTVHDDPSTPEMMLSEKNILQPSVQGFDVGRFLRVKDILEIEQEEDQMLRAYLEEHRVELENETPELLEERINAWQTMCLQLVGVASTVNAELGTEKREAEKKTAQTTADEEELNRFLRTMHEGRLLRH